MPCDTWVMRKLWIAVLWLACPTATLACSLNEDEYRIPTNIELIERADLVVLGRVYADGPVSAAYGNELNLRPIRTLKGQAPKKLTLYGVMRDRQGKPIPPEPTALDLVHSSSTWGACDRQAYAPGTLVVAMFKKRPKGYVQMTYPFARNVEDVGSSEGLWVRAATLYADIIKQVPPAQRRKAFEKERERLLNRSGDPDAQAIAQDITRYLRATAQN